MQEPASATVAAITPSRRIDTAPPGLDVATIFSVPPPEMPRMAVSPGGWCADVVRERNRQGSRSGHTAEMSARERCPVVVREVTVSLIAKSTTVGQQMLLVLAPHGLQRAARRNALTAATAARTELAERAEAFAAHSHTRNDKVPAAG